MPRFARMMGFTAALLLALNSSLRAQEPAYKLGQTDVAAVIGLGGLGDASIAIGGRFERAIKDLPEFGDGVLGIMVGADWWHYSNDVVGTNYDWTYIPISGTANYHFKVESGKWDPFLGLGLGFWIASTPNCTGCSANSGLYFVGRAGVRYYFSPNLAFYADAGAGAATFDVGMNFKLKGGS